MKISRSKLVTGLTASISPDTPNALIWTRGECIVIDGDEVQHLRVPPMINYKPESLKHSCNFYIGVDIVGSICESKATLAPPKDIAIICKIEHTKGNIDSVIQWCS